MITVWIQKISWLISLGGEGIDTKVFLEIYNSIWHRSESKKAKTC